MTEIKSELGFKIVTFRELDTVGISLKVGDIFTVSLDEDPKSGLQWRDEIQNPATEIIMKHLESYVPSLVLGDPGTRKFEYGAHEKGEVTVIFVLGSEGHPVVSAKTLNVTVE